MDQVRQDLVYALRAIARSPGFTAVAIAAFALGIGANSAVFSVIDGILLRPLAFDRPDRLVFLWSRDLKGGYSRGPFKAAQPVDVELTLWDKR